MPCRCDYMEPTQEEKDRAKVIEHLNYSVVKGYTDDDFVNRTFLHNSYNLEGLTQALCQVLTNADQEAIYSDRTKFGLKLALWWTEHQEADRKRKQLEQEEAERKRLVKQALSKLTQQERIALGVEQYLKEG